VEDYDGGGEQDLEGCGDDGGKRWRRLREVFSVMRGTSKTSSFHALAQHWGLSLQPPALRYEL